MERHEIQAQQQFFHNQLQSAKNVASHLPASRELSLALTKLDEARMWLDEAVRKSLPDQYKS